MNHKKVVLLLLIVFVMSALVLSINAAIREEPIICASMWIDNAKTLEDTVVCIGNYTDNTNITEIDNGV